MPSAIIRSFDYRADAQELEILFTTGRRYLYRQVPPDAAQALRAAFSKGRHFNAHIRGHYPYVECTAEEADHRPPDRAPAGASIDHNLR
jgi:hypothetical protein